MQKIKLYPSYIARPFTAFNKAIDAGAMHKSLLDMGESFLTYLVGIMFGEYKRSGDISDRLESEFYKYSSRKPSFGVFLSFMRLLSKETSDTILADKFDKSKKYGSVSDFIFHFSMLKTIIDEGQDSGFSEQAESLMKGRTAGQKGLMDFFDTFIMIRNIYAHPDEKAGPKDNKRKWPLENEYYDYINPHMNAALSELVEDFEILQSYKPILAKLLDDKNKKGTFLVELGDKDHELELDLTNDDLRFINTDLRYLLDPDDKLFVKLYYHAIPQLNPDVAKKIIDREKAKAMEPHMVEMINAKLIDDGKIDDMEYLVLRDTAKTSAISDDRLFQLIDKVKNKLGIKDSVGTPDNLGDIFIDARDDSIDMSFNPWWLHYLSVVGKMDQKVVKDEKSRVDKMRKGIDKLKAEKKSLPINKRLAVAKKKLKDKRAQKSAQIQKINERISAKREMRKKATKAERKAALLEEINSLKENIEQKRNDFDVQIDEMVKRIEEIENEKVAKLADIDDKISEQTHKLEQYFSSTQWGMHKNLWEEMNQYIDSLLDDNINVNLAEKDAVEEGDFTKWVNTPNAWQIGNLSFTYWAKIYSNEAPLGLTYHVGYAITKKFAWFGSNIVDESLVNSLKKPCSVIWTSQDDQYVQRIDIDGLLGRKKCEINNNLLKNYEKELLELGTNVRCTLKGTEHDVNNSIQDYFMHLSTFLNSRDKYTLNTIYSRIWTLDSFFENGKINIQALNKYKREMCTMIPILCNTVTTLNDYALEIGVNQETIKDRFDRYNRLKDVMFIEFEKHYPSGTPFQPTKEESTRWRLFAKEELGIESDYLYNMILDKFRWRARDN